MCRKLILVCCFSLLIVYQGSGQSDYSEKISKNSKATFLDLLKQIFPDVEKDGTAHWTNNIRASPDSDEVINYKQAMHIFSASPVWINTEKSRRLVLNIEVKREEKEYLAWGDLNLIAIYDDATKPRLLEVVDVTADFENFYLSEMRVNPKLTLFQYEYGHLKANEDFHGYAFFYVKDDTIEETLGELPGLYTKTTCKGQMVETGKISAVPNAKNGYHDIVFKIKVTYKRFAQDCQTVKSKTFKNFVLRMTWQKGKYRYPDGGAELKRLRHEEKRLGYTGLED